MESRAAHVASAIIRLDGNQSGRLTECHEHGSTVTALSCDEQLQDSVEAGENEKPWVLRRPLNRGVFLAHVDLGHFGSRAGSRVRDIKSNSYEPARDLG
jgi:hypothetical protein